MTTLHDPRQRVPIAGVPWPLYKLVALMVGLVTLLGVAALTASAAAAVLSAAATATVVWLSLGVLRTSQR